MLLRAGVYDPHIKWKVIETAHFYIYYPTYLSGTALKLGSITEEAYQKLVPFMKWIPEGKIHVVITDRTDNTNGYTTVVPRNKIELFLAPPPLESSLNDYDDWLYMVFVHEFTHVLHLDEHSGIFTYLRRFFGRYLDLSMPFVTSFPILAFPTWIHESIAVYDETKFTHGGRGRSSFSDLMIYTALLEHNFPSLAQLETPPPTWPSGYIPYIWGERFLAYLIHKHGLHSLYTSFKLERNMVFPFWMEITHFLAFHSLAEKDWYKWKKHLRYIARKRGWKRNKKIKYISPPGWSHTSPTCYRDKVFYLFNSGYKRSEIREFDIDTGKTRTLTRGWILPYIGVSRDGNYLVYSKLEYYHKYYLYSDLYLFDLKKHSEKRITYGQRLKYPVFVGNTIFALRYFRGRFYLIQINMKGHIIKKILIPKADNAGFLAFDAEENKLFFSIHSSGKINIMSYDILQQEFKYETHDDLVELYPQVISPHKILFSSDRGGEGYNLFVLKKGRIFRVTDGFNGFFKSCLIKGELYADHYTSRGFRLVRFEDLSWEKEAATEGYHPVNYNFYPLSPTYPSSFYHPFTALLPLNFRPQLFYSSFYGTSAGLYLTGEDVLSFFNYSFNFLHHFFMDTTDYSGWISVQRFEPDFAIGAGRTTSFNGNLPQHRDFFAGQLIEELPSVNSFSKNFLVTYTYYSSSLSTPSSWGRLSLSLIYNSTGYFPLVRGPSDGSNFGLSFILYSPVVGSPFISTMIVGDFKKFVPAWKGVGILEFYGGHAAGDHQNDVLFSFGDNYIESEDVYYSYPDESSFNFRGYTPGEIKAYMSLATSFQLKMPILKINNGIGTIPFWVGEIWGTLFSQQLLYNPSPSLTFPHEYAGNVGVNTSVDLFFGHVGGPLYLNLYYVYRIPDGETAMGMYISFR